MSADTPTEMPSVSRGLVVVPGGGGLIVEGSPVRQVFRGKAATEVLPRLIPLLDGSRDRDGVGREAGLSPAQVDQVLTLLDDRGLLESGARHDPGWSADPETRPYLSRNLSAMSGFANVGELAATLARTVVLLVGDERITTRLGADLAALGVRSVAGRPGQEDQWPRQGVDDVLAVVADRQADPSVLDDTVAWCESREIPVLRTAAAPGSVQVGPCFWPGVTACADCLRRGLREAGWAADGDPDDVTCEFWCGLVMAGLLALIIRLPAMTPPRVMTRFDVTGWASDRRLVVPYADCSACAVHWRASTGAGTAGTYEWSMSRAPRRLQAGADTSPGRRREIGGIAGDRPGFASHPRRPLPPAPAALTGSFGPPAPHDRTPEVDETVLGDLLRRTAGRRTGPADGTAQRWTASGGDFGSVECYLVTEPGLFGLPGTVLRYQDMDDEVVAVRPDCVPPADLLSGTDLAAERFAAVFVLVAAGRRLAGKYRTFAHRLAHLDAGCAATQLAALARGHGTEVVFASEWAEDVAEVLCLAPGDQYVTAIAGIAHRMEGTTCR